LGPGAAAPLARHGSLHPNGWFELAYSTSTIHLFELGFRQDSNDGQGLRPGTPFFPLGALAQGALPPLAPERGFTPCGSNWRNSLYSFLPYRRSYVTIKD
jgi:hypothetical protein